MNVASRVAPILLCLFVPVLGCGDDAAGSGGGADTTTTTTGGTQSGVPTSSSTSTAGDGGAGGGVNPPGCGNGAVEGGEACDDGNTAPDDGCDGGCAVEDGWACDGSPSVCVHLCGNGVLEADEACDDENVQAGDGCGKTCAVELGWTCDGEPSVCSEVCGDGYVTVGEACDDGGTTPGDGCDATCAVEDGFTCDDEPSVCGPLCGDGVILPGENCDDGNPFSGDGCHFDCQVEAGFICSGEPSACSSVLGDTCAFPAVLTPGSNTVYWAATGQDYITTTPSCNSAAPVGPDVVMQFTASFTGEIDFTIDKPVSQRWHLLVNDDSCGTIGPELLCLSNYDSAALTGTFEVTAGQTYYFYLVDSASGSMPLSSPLHVTIVEKAATCGDSLIIGNEACDDGNNSSGDGCSNVCQAESGFSCAGEPSICVPAVGEDCSTSVALSAGPNTVPWVATLQDHFTSPPPCSTALLVGPDIVMHYTATVSGEVAFSFAKPASQRWHLLVNDGVCGTVTPALGCFSDFTNPALAGSFAVTAGTTYYFYLVDSNSGVQPLTNPLNVTITEAAEMCGDGVVFGNEGCDDGNTGSGDGCSSGCAVEPSYVCQGQPSVCFIPPCAPGTNGMIGGTVTTLDTDLPAITEQYLAVDDSPSGWVYVGGLTALHRVPKVGGPSEDVFSLGGLTTANVGYAVLVDGLDIYSVEAKGVDTTGHIWRISDNGGTSWAPTDYATFASVPTRTLQSAVAYGGQLYTLTNTVTTITPTQLWAAPLGGPAPVPATVDLTFVNEARCSGIALDDSYLYVGCGSNDRLVRVDRVTGAVTLLTTAFNLDLNANAVFAHDVDADGSAEYLYFKGPEKRVGYICDPGGASPYVGELATYGSTSSTFTFGMGFDPTTLTLYAYDDSTNEIVIIQ
jgi:cysteine-rich repeat protein